MLSSIKILIFALLAISASSFSSGRSATATLLQVKDKLQVYDQYENILTQITLRPFAFIKDYASNITIEGQLCYVYDIDQFNRSCASKMPANTQWIVSSPFDFEYTNELLKQAKDNNISAVIIIFDSPIDAAGYYQDPKLISLASNSDGELIEAYSLPQREGITGKIEHLYLTNCEVVKSIQIYYILLSIAYGLISFIWIALVWSFYSNHSLTLQRTFLAVPVLKFFQVSIYGMYVGDCPWVNQIQARYLMMALVTISTIYQTVFIAIILLLSKGWNVARNNLSRSDLSSITLLMGAVYLTYSAYYVSINISGMKIFIEFILNILYIGLSVVVTKNTLETRQLLGEQFNILRNNEVRQLLETIQLKRSMMNKYFFVSCCYFFYELVINGLIPTFDQSSDTLDPYSSVVQQYFDLIIIVTLLVIFRPREWPEYFGVGLLDQSFGQDADAEVEQRRLAPLLNAAIDEKALLSMRSKNSSQFNSQQPIVILNPLTNSVEQQRDNQESSSLMDQQYYDEYEYRAYDYHALMNESNERRFQVVYKNLQIGLINSKK